MRAVKDLKVCANDKGVKSALKSLDFRARRALRKPPMHSLRGGSVALSAYKKTQKTPALYIHLLGSGRKRPVSRERKIPVTLARTRTFPPLLPFFPSAARSLRNCNERKERRCRRPYGSYRGSSPKSALDREIPRNLSGTRGKFRGSFATRLRIAIGARNGGSKVFGLSFDYSASSGSLSVELTELTALRALVCARCACRKVITQHSSKVYTRGTCNCEYNRAGLNSALKRMLCRT